MLDYAAATRLDRQLRELPEILAHAYLALLPGAGARGARVSGATRSAPLPCNLEALSWLGPVGGPDDSSVRDLRHDQDGVTPVLGTLTSWARLVEAEMPCQCREHQHACRPDETTIGSLLAYLASRPVIAWTVRQMWADEYATEINDVHRHATRLSRTRPRRTPMRMPCPVCDMLSLVREDGRDIECITPHCPGVLRQSEYDHRAEKYLAELYAA